MRDLLGEGDIVATYPSGAVIPIRNCKLWHGKIDGVYVIMAEQKTGQRAGFIFDSRAMVTVNGVLAYRPRQHLDKLLPVFQEWMTENPTWDFAS